MLATLGAGLIGLLAFWLTPEAATVSTLNDSAEHKVAVSAAATSDVPTDVASFSGFPAAVRQDVPRRYAFAKDCAKFRSFDTFYRERAKDPSWPLNNAKALADADPALRATILSTAKFLEEHRAECEPWLKSTNSDLASAQIYRAALQAALNGDKDAAACFVMAPWQKPDEYSPYYENLAADYANNVRRLVDDGLRVGSWPVVFGAYQAVREQHGLQTRAGFNNQDAYLFARLAQQAAPDATVEAQYGYQAATAAKGLTAGNLTTLDAQALSLYVGPFKRQRVSLQSVVDMCAN